VVGRRYLKDLFEMMGNYVDSLKFAGGSFTLMPNKAVKEIIDLCHKHDVLVSTGGFIERVLAQNTDAVRQYVAECKRLGFDIVEISASFVSLPTDDLAASHLFGAQIRNESEARSWYSVRSGRRDVYCGAGGRSVGMLRRRYLGDKELVGARCDL
jgi:hypothetical protein